MKEEKVLSPSFVIDERNDRELRALGILSSMVTESSEAWEKEIKLGELRDLLKPSLGEPSMAKDTWMIARRTIVTGRPFIYVLNAQHNRLRVITLTYKVCSKFVSTSGEIVRNRSAWEHMQSKDLPDCYDRFVLLPDFFSRLEAELYRIGWK